MVVSGRGERESAGIYMEDEWEVIQYSVSKGIEEKGK